VPCGAGARVGEGLLCELLPVTWTLALRAARRQEQLQRLEPQLAAIRERYGEDAQARMQKTLELYRRHGLSRVDGIGVLGALVQLPIVWCLYQALRERAAAAATGFLWIRSLGRPDVVLAVLAAATTLLAMVIAPHLPEQARLGIMLVPAIVCFFAALHFSSGIVLYWVTSNLCSTAQTFVLRKVLARPR